MVRRAVTVLLVALALAACSVAVEDDGDTVATGSNTAESGADQSETEQSGQTAQRDEEGVDEEPTPEQPGPDPDAPAEEPEVDEPATVRFAFGGDVHGEAQVGQLLASGGNPLAAFEQLFADVDITVANLETAVGSSGTPAAKTYVFQASPALTDALAAAGVDAVSVANNHALDFGTEALSETLAVAEESGLVVVGGGADAAEAYAPRYFDVDGLRVGLVGLTRVIPTVDWAATAERPGLASTYEPVLPQALAAIEEADAAADLVVVAVHWGLEGAACPALQQTSLAREFVDAGADVVAGHHPHVLQGVQETDGALVAYSLGNFVWYASREPSRITGVLTVEADPDGVVSWDFVPARIDDTGSPQPLSGDDATAVADLLAARSPGGAACGDIDWP